MDLFARILQRYHYSVGELLKLITDIFDHFVGTLEYLYPDFGVLEVSSEFQTVQDVIDNMITRLEELTSVVNMIKMKNTDCSSTVSSDINKHRFEVTTLSKKIATLNTVVLQLQANIDIIEKQVEKAELDFGVSNDNKLKSLFKPFLKRNQQTNIAITSLELNPFTSVLGSFNENVDGD